MQLTVNGETFNYVKEGEGPTVVFLHFLGGFSYQWRHQIAALKARFTCIAFDHRGFGFSTFNEYNSRRPGDRPSGAMK